MATIFGQMNRLKSDIKIDLINFFDVVKSNIDISAQKIYENLEKDETVDDLEKTMNELELEEFIKEKNDIRNGLLKFNMDLINKVDSVLEINLKYINDYFESISHPDRILKTTTLQPKEEIKCICLPKFCYFIKSEELRKIYRTMYNPFGVLVLTDFYMNQNVISYLDFKLKQKNKEDIEKAELVFDNGVLLIRAALKRNIKLQKHYAISLINDGKMRLRQKDGLKEMKSLLIKTDEENENCNMNLFQKKIREIKPDTFLKLIRVENLNLSGNKLVKIEQNTFNGLINLKELGLDNNEIEEINENSFQSMPNLKTLVLSSNKIKNIQSNLFKNLVNMQNLFINENLIESIDDFAFSPMTNLRTIELETSTLKNISKNTFFGLVNLIDLHFKGDEVINIEEDAFASLGNLTGLYLTLPKIESLKDEMFNGLGRLKRFNLHIDNIQLITNTMFSNFTDLADLKIKSNKANELESNPFNYLNNLKFLEFTLQRLSKIDSSVFNGLKNLTHLTFLNAYGLKKIEDDAFKPLTKLTFLTLRAIENPIMLRRLKQGTDYLQKYYGLSKSVRHITLTMSELVSGDIGY